MPAGKDQSVASKTSLRSRPRRSPKQRVEKFSGESQETFGVLFENNPIPMWVCDRESLALLEVNEAAAQKYGYSRADFRNMTVEDLLPKVESRGIARGGKRNSTALQLSGERRHVLKNGREIDVEVKSHKLNSRGGTPFSSLRRMSPRASGRRRPSLLPRPNCAPCLPRWET